MYHYGDKEHDFEHHISIFFIHGTLDVEPPTKLWGLANSIRTTIERRQKTRGCFLSALPCE